jgi:hypothetical protein
MLFVDNIRLTMIALVVCHHAVITYCDIGLWYYQDPVVPGPGTSLLFQLFISFNQSYFMGTLFALAGYFSAMSLQRKGGPAFLRGRLLRLGVPTLFYALVLNPLTVELGHGEMIRSLGGFAAYYGRYVTSLEVLSGSGPMWFTLALLFFCLAYVGLRALRGVRPGAGQARPLTAGLLCWCIVLCALGTFAVRLAYPVGRTVFNMQLAYFVQYIVLFTFGIMAHDNDWLRAMDGRLGRGCLAVGLANWAVWGMVLAGFGSFDRRLFSGGPQWQSLTNSLWFSISGVCLTVGLIALFRARLNRQSALVAALSDSAFAVYLFHPPILVALARLVEPAPLAALPKALLLGALSLPACFAVAWGVRRVPVLRDLVPQ